MSIETIRPIEVEQYRLINQFSKMLVLDLGMTEYLSQMNHSEMTYREEFTEAMNFTSFLIRKAVFSTFVDILDYGDTTSVREAVEVLELCRKYREYEIEAIKIPGNAQDVFDRIDHFIKDVQGIDYFNTYIKGVV